jgi:hypothetical protein
MIRMAAILNPSTSPAPWNLESERPLRPQLRLVAPLGDGPYVAGPRGADRHAAARRPLVSIAGGLGLALLVSLAVLGVLNLLGADAAASGPVSTAAATHPAGAGAHTSSAPVEVVVQPGDTLWSIARRLQPSGDVRQLVDRLASRAGGAAVASGQRLDITGLGD